MVGIHAGEEIELKGSWTTHQVYGKQLKVDSFNKSIPKTVQGIERYLASGAIKGVGAKTANKIVKHFGLDTLKIIEKEPQVLATIQGISKNKALEIGREYHEQYELRTALLALQEFGISPTYAIKIYQKYKEHTVELIKQNPYRLANDIFGIGFKRADEIAKQIGIEDNDINRIKTGILYILNQFSSSGHTYAPKNILFKECIELLNIDNELFEVALMDLNLNNQVLIKNFEEHVAVFLRGLYTNEQNIACKLIELSEMKDFDEIRNFEKEITKTARELKIELVQEQKDAIKNVLQNGVTVITGGPGTGKTTTINALIHMLKKSHETYSLTAPTGRAAKRMSEATHETAQTIHRLLEINFAKDGETRQYFNRDTDNPLEVDVVIVDEMSMVDVNLMQALVNALVVGQRIVLIGDVDQLPSVGAGNVLKDIIVSNKIPVIELTQIFRQANQSAIIRNAHKINKGEYPVSNEKDSDFFFVKRSIQEEVKSEIVNLITTRLPKYKSIDILKDIQVLAPMRKGVLGVNELNKVLQEALNPPSTKKPEYEFRQTVFRKGDKIMQIKNNYQTPWKILGKTGMPIEEDFGVFNGDCGIISDINKEQEKLIVTFDDLKVVEYEFNQLDELELAYAVTIHKSQGSEYPVVAHLLFAICH